MKKHKISCLTAIKRIYAIAFCDHRGCKSISIEAPDSTRVIICRACGRVLSLNTSGERRHNPHWDYDQTGDHLDLPKKWR